MAAHVSGENAEVKSHLEGQAIYFLQKSFEAGNYRSTLGVNYLRYSHVYHELREREGFQKLQIKVASQPSTLNPHASNTTQFSFGMP